MKKAKSKSGFIKFILRKIDYRLITKKNFHFSSNKKSLEVEERNISLKKRKVEDEITDINPPTPASILHPELNTTTSDEGRVIAESHSSKGESYIDFKIVSPWYGDNQIKRGIFYR